MSESQSRLIESCDIFNVIFLARLLVDGGVKNSQKYENTRRHHSILQNLAMEVDVDEAVELKQTAHSNAHIIKERRRSEEA